MSAEIVIVISAVVAVAGAVLLRARLGRAVGVHSVESSRRWALRELRVSRLRQYWDEQHSHLGVALRLAIGGGIVVAALVPRVDVGFGPFNSEQDSKDFLQTVWQVLAAAVGVSVALVAFVLQAFLTSGERRHGGTLREFADQTGLLWLFDLAAVSLVVDGLALAEVGGLAPAGWPGLLASVLSGVTLVGLLVVVPRTILRALDPNRLTELRAAAARDVTRRAVREQLIGQLVMTKLLSSSAETGVTRGLAASGEQNEVLAGKDGVVHDIRLGALNRAATPNASTPEQRIEVLVDIEQAVGRDTPVLAVPAELAGRQLRRLRRSVRIRRGRADQASAAIIVMIDRLRQQAIAAVRRRDEVELRGLARLVEDILLELPRTSGRLGISFDEAVSQPGVFGYGPATRLFHLLRDLLEEAIEHGAERLADSVLFTPQRVAVEASSLDAPAVVGEAAMFYVAGYARARRKAESATATVAAVAEAVRKDAIERVFDMADLVGGHAIAFEAGDSSLEDAQVNISRVFAAVQELLKAAIGYGDDEAFEDALRRLADVVEPWDDWHDDARGGAQRALRQELATMRLALASWSASQLTGGGASDRDASLQNATFRLLDEPTVEQLVAAYPALADRGASFGTDWSLWFYDDDAGGVQSLDGDVRLAEALVLGLAMRAQAPAGLSLPSGTGWLGWRYEQLEGALARLGAEPRRFAPAIGIPVPADVLESPPPDVLRQIEQYQ